MKSLRFLAVAALGILLSQTAPAADTNAPVNYVIKVMMKDAKGNDSSLQVTTIDGQFELDTLQKNPVKINNNDIPTTLKLSGALTTINEQKGRLNFYLGRTVPYVTGSFNNGSPMGGSESYSQLSVGLQSNFVVTFGKPLVVQVDESGEVSVLVTREKN